jgi:hypothetical protein
MTSSPVYPIGSGLTNSEATMMRSQGSSEINYPKIVYYSITEVLKYETANRL